LQAIYAESRYGDFCACVLRSPQCTIKIMDSSREFNVFLGDHFVPASGFSYNEGAESYWTNMNSLYGFLKHRYPDRPFFLPNLPGETELANYARCIEPFLEELIAACSTPRPRQWWKEYDEFRAAERNSVL
jgi:hypothetical protein